MISQREYFRVNDKKGIVQGVFYIHGKRVWRKLCSIDVAELLPSGRHRSEKQRATFLAGLYAEGKSVV